MNLRIATLAAACIGAASLAVAQPTATTPHDTATPPSTSAPSDTTTPPSTSTPSAQTESPPSTGTNPSSASSPHQREAMAKDSHDKMMKDCIAKQRSENSSLSKSDAKKTCKEQMKSSGSEPANR